MNTAEDWKRERIEREGCRYCNGSGWRASTYSSGPSPCGCDEPTEDDGEQVGTGGEAEREHKPSATAEFSKILGELNPAPRGEGTEAVALLQEVIANHEAAWCQECAIVQEGGDLRNRVLSLFRSTERTGG